MTNSKMILRIERMERIARRAAKQRTQRRAGGEMRRGRRLERRGARLVGRMPRVICKVDAARGADEVEGKNSAENAAKSPVPRTMLPHDVVKTRHGEAHDDAWFQHPIEGRFECSKPMTRVPRSVTSGGRANARRQSFPQPDHRLTRPSLRRRTCQPFSRTSAQVSAKNHLGPPQ
jgi:hypothetical protein